MAAVAVRGTGASSTALPPPPNPRSRSDQLACRTIVQATREAGVRTGEHGLNNITLDEWGLHLYYNNESLVNRRGLNSRGYPWHDPANAFAADYAYTRGTLPQADDLFSRSSLLAIPPSLSEGAADRIVDAYRDAASRYGLLVRS